MEKCLNDHLFKKKQKEKADCQKQVGVTTVWVQADY